MLKLLIFKTLSFVYDTALLGFMLWLVIGIPFSSAFLIAFIGVWLYEEIYEYVEYNKFGDLK